MRIDKLLWFLRLTKTRNLAQAIVADGHVRLNGRRVERGHQTIAAGDILVVPLGQQVRVIRLLALPKRRGPASEAQACYQMLDERQDYLIAGQNIATAARGDLQP